MKSLFSRKNLFCWVPSLILIALLALPPALLIAEDIQRDTEGLRRETQAEQKTALTARAAKQKKAFDKAEEISFEEILAQPDNIELNFQYAQQQVKENDLLGAASTLERILLINPNLPQVRLFYAVVLFRLDNLTEAERELDAVSSLPMPDDLRKELKLYRRQINLRKKRTRFNIRESVGFQWDSNRNSSPSSKHNLFFEIPIDVTGNDRRRQDNSFLNITTLGFTHDLGFQAGHEFFGSFTYFLQNQNHVDDLDLQSLQYEVGGTYKSRWFHFTPSFYASHIFLAKETFLRVQGGNFEISRNFFNRLDVYSAFHVERQDYRSVSKSPTARGHFGTEVGLENGVSFLITPNMKGSLGIDYTRKNAKEEFNAYDRLTLRAGHTWLLGKGQFVINTLDTDFDYYQEPDVTIAGRIRRDKGFRYRMTYGAPLTFFLIGKILPGPFKDVTLSFTYEYYRSLSNITNYTYTNNKLQGLLTKSLEF